jgi:hypothetical protein
MTQSSESHFFKTVSQELCPSDGRSRRIAADGRRPCEGARRCQAFAFGLGADLEGEAVEHALCDAPVQRGDARLARTHLLMSEVPLHVTLGIVAGAD